MVHDRIFSWGNLYLCETNTFVVYMYMLHVDGGLISMRVYIYEFFDDFL